MSKYEKYLGKRLKILEDISYRNCVRQGATATVVHVDDCWFYFKVDNCKEHHANSIYTPTGHCNGLSEHHLDRIVWLDESQTKQIVCECGSEKTYGEYATHSDWCPKWI